MNAPVPTDTGFTEAEFWTPQETLRERYGEGSELQFGEAERRLNRHDRQPATCPVVAWQDGTGIDRFDDLAECVVTLLRVQADRVREMHRETAEALPR